MSDVKTTEKSPPPVSAGAPDITTAGWDTVFALRLSHVNELLAAAIRAGDLVLPSVDWSVPDPSGGQFSISAPLVGFAFVGDPSLSGSQTKVKISVGPGTLEYDGGTYQTSAADVFGQLDLRRIDDPKFVSISAQPATDFLPSGVANLTLTDAQQKASTGRDLQEAYKAAFQAGVETNLQAFQLVLAKVDLQSALLQSARWLAPVAVGHCVAGGADASGNADAGTALAIMCMTDPFVAGNPLPPPSFDSRLIPKDAKAAFLISGPKFTRNLLFAGIAQALYSPGKPLTPDQLAQIEKDRLQITGQDASQVISMKPGAPAIPLQTVQVDVSPLYAVFSEAILTPFLVPAAIAGILTTVIAEMVMHGGRPNLIIPVSVQMQSLEVKRQGASVQFTVGVHCPVNIGSLSFATINLTLVSNYSLQVANGTFQFVRESSFVSTQSVDLPDWLTNSQTVAEVVATIAGLIVTVVTEGDAAALIAISIGIIDASVQATPQMIAQSIAQGAGVSVPAGFDGFVATAVSPVAWMQNASFSAQSLAMGEAILFAGQLAPKR